MCHPLLWLLLTCSRSQSALAAEMLSEQTAALGAGWESASIQLGGAEPQVDRGNREGPWRTAPGPLEHLHCGPEEEPLSLQEKGKNTQGVSEALEVLQSLLKKCCEKSLAWLGAVADTCNLISWRLR